MLLRLSHAVAGLLLLTTDPGRAADEAARADERALAAAHLPSDAPALLQYLRKRTLSEADRNNVQALIRLLGDEAFAVREKASADLVVLGRSAIPLLRNALRDRDPEVVRRATGCLSEIESGATGVTSAAVTRALARLKPADATGVLLNFLPHAEDEWVADEVRAALAALAVRDGRLDPVLLQALKDRQPSRRAAAAEALTRSGSVEGRRAARPALDDVDPVVRLHAALAFYTVKDKEAVPALIALLTDLPPEQGRRAEDVLFQVAGDKSPPVVLDSQGAAREKCRTAWDAWWRQHGPGLDLARVGTAAPYLGLTLVCERDRGLNARIRELAPDGTTRWQIDNLRYPMDAEVIGPERVLIAESVSRSVSERDFKGKIIWQKQFAEIPYCVHRQPNGNTLVTTSGQVVELDRTGKEVFTYRPPPAAGPPRAARRLRDGSLALVTMGLNNNNGLFYLLDPRGKEVKNFPVARPYIYARFDFLPNGNVLIPDYTGGRVVEYDMTGRTVRTTPFQQPVAVNVLPNGHLLITSSLTRKSVELDRTGKQVWAYNGEGILYRVRRR